MGSHKRQSIHIDSIHEPHNPVKAGAMSVKLLPGILPCLAAAMLSACGGGGSGPPQGVILGASPAGIWRGMDSTTGLAVVGLIDATGEAEFTRSDNALFSGALSTAEDNSISAAGHAYALNQSADTSSSGSWTMHGTLKERQTLSVTLSVTTTAGTQTEGTLELTFDPLYDQPSSLTSLNGEFAQLNTLPYEVSNGTIALSELICEGNGQFSIIDAAHDLYRVQMTTRCDNGEQSTWTGLATLDTSVSPEHLLVGWSGGGSGDSEDWILQD